MVISPVITFHTPTGNELNPFTCQDLVIKDVNIPLLDYTLPQQVFLQRSVLLSFYVSDSLC